MDPHGALVVFTEMMQGCIYEGLVRVNKDNGFEPALAKSYSRIAPDTWRFILRPGVRLVLRELVKAVSSASTVLP